MKGDFSKFKSPQQIAREHYVNVFQQQGRVSLDQDWNEQSQINTYRSELALTDIIGKSGAPVDNAGFKIEAVLTTSPPSSPVDSDVTISNGRYYVDGILCENDDEHLIYENQPDLPSASLPTTEGNYLFFLDVWLMHQTATEENRLREVALGGPDTTTRTKVIWQVKCVELIVPASPPDCVSASLPDDINPNPGTLSARSELTQDASNPCDNTATGGYRRLQNQLYRVEIHKGGDISKATFKWSRDNASVITNFLDYDIATPEELKVSSIGKDELLGFNSGDWIEIIDNTTELLNKPGTLAQISKPPQNNIITIDTTSISFPDSSITAISFDPKKNPRIRKWDSQQELPTLITANNGWVKLEDGVQVNFGGKSFNTGDYWLIPARTATTDVEWENDKSNNPVQLPPFGIEHHYAKLAIASFDGTNSWIIFSDCRNLFPALTELTSLYYVGGDGQEAIPGGPLPEPLMVGVANGSCVVSGAKVKFEILSGGGSLDNGFGTLGAEVIVMADTDGVAGCIWTLDSDTSNPGLQVKASLLDDAGNLVVKKLPVIFSAGFNRGTNNKKCSFTVGSNGDFPTLEDAISKTFAQKSLCICLLPEQHKISSAIKIEDKEFIKITGCGASVLMESSEMLIFSNTIVLHQLNVQAVNNFARIVLQANDIYADYCTFNCMENDFYMKTPFILISAPQKIFDSKTDTSLVHWNNNQLSVGKNSKGIGLGLTQQVGGWIENNVIKGTLVLQYFKELDWSNDIFTKIGEMIKSNHVAFVGQLNIRGNVFNNVYTNSTGFRESKIIANQSLMVSENVFVKVIESPTPFSIVSFNNFIAQFINITSNHFIQQNIKTLVQVVGQQGIALGNQGTFQSVLAFFENTQIQMGMEAFRKVLPPPKLNLANVS